MESPAKISSPHYTSLATSSTSEGLIKSPSETIRIALAPTKVCTYTTGCFEFHTKQLFLICHDKIYVFRVGWEVQTC